MQSRLNAALLISMALAACGESAPHTAAPAPLPAPIVDVPTAPKACERSSWLAGSTELCEGRLIYRDYVYDDHGAANGRLNTPYSAATLSLSAGAARYPAGLENTADLLRFELWLDGNEVRLEYQLNTLFKGSETLAAIAIDTDNNPATGGGELPGLGVSAPGWELFRTFVLADADRNLILGRFPKPDGRVWRVHALLAQADGTVMNVAFRGIDETALAGLSTKAPANNLPGHGNFFEDLQAAALQAGDIGTFAATVEVADLEQRRSKPPETASAGLHERVYTSAYTVPRGVDETAGEGVAPAGVPGRGDGGDIPALAQNFVFLGRHQPYALYVPANLPKPAPLQMVFHGSGAAHASQLNQPGFQQAFGEAFGRLLVSPLGRGPAGYGSDFAERDLLDVMADVGQHHAIDADRVIASGYSQGGYISFRMAALYPQVFAGLVEWVGVTGNRLAGTPLAGSIGYNAGVVGDMTPFLGNLRHIPSAMLHGAADELAPLPATRATDTAFLATENIFEWFLHPVAEHLTFLALDDWRKEAAYTRDFKRVQNPARVGYRTDPKLGNAALGIAHDRAYWVSGIRTREAGPGVVDLLNHACGGSTLQAETGMGAGLDPVPWTSDRRAATGMQPLSKEALIEGSLQNIAELTIDAAATCLAGMPLRLKLQGDGAVTLRLSDGRSVTLPAGSREVSL